MFFLVCLSLCLRVCPFSGHGSRKSECVPLLYVHHVVSRKSFRGLQGVTKYMQLKSHNGGIDSVQNF